VSSGTLNSTILCYYCQRMSVYADLRGIFCWQTDGETALCTAAPTHAERLSSRMRWFTESKLTHEDAPLRAATSDGTVKIFTLCAAPIYRFRRSSHAPHRGLHASYIYIYRSVYTPYDITIRTIHNDGQEPAGLVAQIVWAVS